MSCCMEQRRNTSFEFRPSPANVERARLYANAKLRGECAQVQPNLRRLLGHLVVLEHIDSHPVQSATHSSHNTDQSQGEEVPELNPADSDNSDSDDSELDEWNGNEPDDDDDEPDAEHLLVRIASHYQEYLYTKDDNLAETILLDGTKILSQQCKETTPQLQCEPNSEDYLCSTVEIVELQDDLDD